MNKPAIAFLAQPFDGVLPPYQNSVGIYTYEIAQRLSDEFEVHVIIPHIEGREKKELIRGSHFHYLSTNLDKNLQKVFRKIFGYEALTEFSHRYYHLIYVIQAALLIRKYQCRIVHTYNFSQFPRLLKLINPELKTLVSMRCEWLSQLPRQLIYQQLKSVDSVIGCSEYITGKAEICFPESKTVFDTIHTGFDTYRINYRESIASSDNNTVLFVGRISPEKGVHTLIEAFAIAKRFEPALKLCLVGGHGQLKSHLLVDLADDPRVKALQRFYQTGSPTEYIDHIKGLITKHKLESSVEFVGGVPYEEVVVFQSKAFVLVNPSLSEAFGRAPVEAMSIGLPVIASRVGGHPELIGEDKTIGLLVEPEQPTEMAEAILTLFKDRSMRKSFASGARQCVEQLYSWENISNKLKVHYRTMLD